jgi:hypothetical protein
MAVTGQDVDSIARIAWRVIYEAVAHIIRYL